MFNLILPLIFKSKNFVIGVIGVILLLFIISFVDNYFEAKEQIEEYKKIEAIVKTQNQNTKENVKTIKKSIESNTDSDDDKLFEQIFGEE
jgi:uncharacterized membrane protein YfhO